MGKFTVKKADPPPIICQETPKEVIQENLETLEKYFGGELRENMETEIPLDGVSLREGDVVFLMEQPRRIILLLGEFYVFNLDTYESTLVTEEMRIHLNEFVDLVYRSDPPYFPFHTMKLVWSRKTLEEML